MLVCVSRGSYSCGLAFAERLAAKLGCPCIGREELLDRATEAGVAAAKLEVACLRPRGLNERMLLEREHFQAFATAYLAERALQGPLVYHGRTGHLLLQNISHVLRIRVVADMERRIKSVEERLGLDRSKAKRYINDVEDDRRRWGRTFYNVDWDAAAAYDFIINVEHASVDNLATAFCSVAQLPDFRETPASRRTLEDLLLANRCRVALAKDDRTYNASFQVRVERGVVSVTYLPRYSRVAAVIPEVLERVSGVVRVLHTMAATRILWIEERFDPKTETFRNLLDLAGRWEAAIDLLQLRATDSSPIIELAADDMGPIPSDRQSTGGIEDDAPSTPEGETPSSEGGMEETYAELARVGRAGGRTVVCGTARAVVDSVDTTTPYSLAVVGDAFLDKGKAARVRLTRELGNALQERIRVAVVQADEMKEQYLFGPRQLLSMILHLALIVLVYLLVFTHQKEVLGFLAREGTRWRILAAATIFLFVPLVAYIYGKTAHYLLKLIKME